MRKVLIVAVMVALGAATGAEAQFFVNLETYGSLVQTQLGNLGYARYRGFGARALGMGGAFIALSDDVTAASWNPAGLAQIANPTFAIGGAYAAMSADQRSGISGTSEYIGQVNTSSFGRELDFSVSDSQSHPEFAGYAHRFPIGASKWNVGIGASYFNAFVFDQDLSRENMTHEINYTNQETGQTLNASINDGDWSELFEGSLENYALAVAANYDDRVLIGVAYTYWTGDLDGRESIAQAGAATSDIVDFDFRISRARATQLSMKGWSPSVGLIVKPFADVNLRFGAVYKPGFTLTVDGFMRTDTSTEQNGQLLGSGEINYLFEDAEVDYPASFGAGVAWKPAFGWMVALDWTKTEWSGTLLEGQIEAGDDIPAGSAFFNFPSLTLLSDTRTEQDLEGFAQFDTTAWRFGIEKIVFSGDYSIPIRAGAFLEDAYRNYTGIDRPLEVEGFSLGLGLYKGRWQLDFAVVYEAMSQDLTGGSFDDLRPAVGDWVVTDYTYDSGRFEQNSTRALLSLLVRLGAS